jgi:hypothetical protein
MTTVGMLTAGMAVSILAIIYVLGLMARNWRDQWVIAKSTGVLKVSADTTTEIAKETARGAGSALIPLSEGRRSSKSPI